MLKSLVTKLLDLLNFQLYDPGSHIRQFAQRHHVISGILLLPSIVLISFSFLIIAPFAVFLKLTLDAIRFAKRLLIRGRWKKTIRTIGSFLIQILVFFLVLFVGQLLLNVFVNLLHHHHSTMREHSFERAVSLFISVYTCLLIFKIAAINWLGNQDPKKLDLEKERNEALTEFESAKRQKLHLLFRQAEYQNTSLAFASALSSPSTLILLFNFVLSSTILLSALCLHEVNYLTDHKWFSGVSIQNQFAEWLFFVFHRVVKIIPVDILEVFDVELTHIKPVAPYGTSLVFIVNASIAWILLSFIYGFYNRARKTITRS